MLPDSAPPFPQYSRAEEAADRIVHAVGLACGAAALVPLAVLAARRGDAAIAISLTLYGGALAGMLTCSALYNLARPSPRKERLRRFDHAAIFIMIAGTYTPFAASMPDGSGAKLLVPVWAVAIAGALLKLLRPRRFERLSIALYLMLGWSFLAAFEEVLAALPWPATILLLTGGLLYTGGVLLHLCTRLPFHNAGWHALVLAAAGCHYAAVLTCVGP